MSAIEATARGSGPYVVYVNDVEYSRHTAEREALENASEALAENPSAAVRYEHEYVVDVVLVDAPEEEEPTEPEPPVDEEPEPEDPPSGVEPFFTDSFDGGQKHDANGFSWLGGGMPVVEFDGAHAMLFRYGPDAPGEDSHREQRFDFGRDLAEVWVEYSLYVPDNFTVRDDRPGNNKLVGFWATTYNNPLQVVFEYQGWPEADVRVLCISNVGGCNSGGTKHTHVLDETMRGEWLRIRVHLRAGEADGVVALWRDDTLVYSYDPAPLWTSSGVNSFRRGYLLGWANSGFTEETRFYITDFRVWGSDPGW